MADTKLSAFTSTASVNGTETLPVLQAGANKRVLLSAVKTSYLDTLYQPLDANLLAGPIISGASPVLSFKDSDCTDDDVNFDITAAATDTGTGAEDIDVVFAAQVAGTKVSFLTFDADGRLALGYNGQSVHTAKLVYGTPVTAVTTTASPATTDSGSIYTNEGDADGAAITLPAAQTSPSLVFTFVVQAAQTLTITAGAGDTIRVAGNVTGAAGSISCATVGSVITLACINATEWVATSVVGTWS